MSSDEYVNVKVGQAQIDGAKAAQAAYCSIALGERNGMPRVFLVMHGGEIPEGQVVTHAFSARELGRWLRAVKKAERALKRQVN